MIKEKKNLKSPAGNWPAFRITDSWSVFKIMAEFVNGYETLSQLGPCISIFGSARTKSGDKYYKMAEELAQKLAKAGFGVMTGGGPGIMEAGNKGAKQQGGLSVGVFIDLIGGERPNEFIDHDKLIQFDYFFARKVMLIKYSQAFVVFPGGFGTLDELFEALTLIQTEKIERFPVILVGTQYWQGLLDWIKTQMLDENGYIDKAHLHKFSLCDSADEAFKQIAKFYKTHTLAPNF